MKLFGAILPLSLLPYLVFSQGILGGVISGKGSSGTTPPPVTGDSYEWLTLKAAPSQMGHGAEGFDWTGTTCIGYWTNASDTNSGSYQSAGNYYTGTLKYLKSQPCKMWIIPRINVHQLSSDYNTFSSGGGYYGNKYVVGALAPYPGLYIYGGSIDMLVGNVVWRGTTFNYGDGGNPGDYDTFRMRNASYFWFSDNTAMHGPDEVVSGDNFRWLILQNSFMLEGYDSHNRGGLFSVDASVDQVQPLSVYDVSYIHCDKRFPNIEGDINDPLEVINVTSWAGQGRIFSSRYGLQLNLINNYHKRGVGSGTPFFKWNPSVYLEHQSLQFSGGSEGFAGRYDDLNVYASGNIITGRVENEFADNKPYFDIHINANGYTKDAPWPDRFFKSPFTPHPFGTDVLYRRAIDAWDYNVVGKNVGARYYTDSNGARQKYILPYVDAYIQDAINGTYNEFRNTSTGAPFTLAAMNIPAAGTPHADTDFDGMPDMWEAAHGLSVGTQDHDGVKVIWVLDGREWINTVGYTNMQVCADYFHGGLIRLRDRIEYNATP